MVIRGTSFRKSKGANYVQLLRSFLKNEHERIIAQLSQVAQKKKKFFFEALRARERTEVECVRAILLSPAANLRVNLPCPRINLLLSKQQFFAFESYPVLLCPS
jgi:hypothetical protein